MVLYLCFGEDFDLRVAVSADADDVDVDFGRRVRVAVSASRTLGMSDDRTRLDGVAVLAF